MNFGSFGGILVNFLAASRLNKFGGFVPAQSQNASNLGIQSVEFRNSNSIFLGNKKIRIFFVKSLEQFLSRLAKKVFKNNIVSLGKIQIYSNLNFLKKNKNHKNL
jgi:hypothetical protein